MNVLESIDALGHLPGPVSLAIGVFDGVHRGHRAVIRHAVEATPEGGSSVVVTFNPHPQRVLCPDRAPRMLTSTQHKIRILRRLGISNLLLVPFTTEFARTGPRDFIHALHAACNGLASITVGQEWTFGRNRSGNLMLLDRMGAELGFAVEGVAHIKDGGGEAVSSTRIRLLVESGDLAAAASLLGRPFTVYGTVVEGRRLGRQIGFPTANLSVHNEQLPPSGVYAARAEVGERRVDGVVNIGKRPTVSNDGSRRLLEIHLFDFDADLYGSDIEVEFLSFLREEIRFGSVEDLAAQIRRDAERAKAVLRESDYPNVS